MIITACLTVVIKDIGEYCEMHQKMTVFFELVTIMLLARTMILNKLLTDCSINKAIQRLKSYE